MTDVVSADPLLTVAINSQSSSELDSHQQPLSLCYQVHGDGDTYYNLLTTPFTSANGLWSSVDDSGLHLLTEIGVQTLSENGECYNILIQLEDCTITINDFTTKAYVQFISSGVNVTRVDDRVIVINVSDGSQDDFVIEVECEVREMVRGGEEMEVPLLQLRVTRPWTSLSGSANGLLDTVYYIMSVTVVHIFFSFCFAYFN